MSTRQLAEQLGKNPETVDGWESGEDIEADDLQVLSTFFGVSPGYLVEGPRSD